MDVSAPHFGFVVASYGLSALVLLAMTAAVLVRDRRLRKAQEQDHEKH